MSVRQQVASQGAAASSDDAVLDVQAMTTEVRVRRGVFKAVDGVSFAVGRGEILGIVGESGCGKTMTALTLMRLLPPSARVQGGHAWLDGVDLLSLSPAAMRRVRGKEISMVFQEPMTSLDPAFTVGDQIVETIRAHEDVGKEEALERAVRILEDVGIPNSGKRLRDYPHQFSGGMRQRVMLAIALVLRPKLVVADEPTTALDVTIQAQILELIAALRSEFGMSVILITHNLGVVHEVADRVAIMYAGEIVETGPASLHPGTPAQHSRSRHARPPPARHPRARAGAVRAAAGVPFRSPVRKPDRALRTSPSPPRGPHRCP